ncbi:MAG: hypothetical protein H7306_09875 [Bacteriovorax sp.]|nr:hypothetical protein [Rhizobacter sp.]
MARTQVVDNVELSRWRALPSSVVLRELAEHAKQDVSYKPTGNQRTTRWHVSAGGTDFEILCEANKFYDTRAAAGGGGAVDLAIHLFGLKFKAAVKVLREKKL